MELNLYDFLKYFLIPNTNILTKKDKTMVTILKDIILLNKYEDFQFVKEGMLAIFSSGILTKGTCLQRNPNTVFLGSNPSVIGFFEDSLNDDELKFVLDIGNSLSIPVLKLPKTLKYKNLKAFFSEYLRHRGNGLIKKISQILKIFLESFLDEGVQGLLEQFYYWTGGKCTASIDGLTYDYPKHIDAFTFKENCWEKDVSEDIKYPDIFSYLLKKSTSGSRCYVAFFKTNIQEEGYFAVVDTPFIGTGDLLFLMDYVRLLMKLEGKGNRLIHEVERKYHRDILNQLLFKEYEEKSSLFKLPKGISNSLHSSGRIILLKSATPIHCLERLVEKNFPQPTLSGLLDDFLGIIYWGCKASDNFDWERLISDFRLYQQGSQITISIGGHYGLKSLWKSYEEAYCALVVGETIKIEEKPIYYFERLGFYQFLKKYIIESTWDHLFYRYYQRYLKPLKKNNDESFESLLKTIDVYIKNNYNYSNTADGLFMHPNTVRYRIAQIEKICSVDFKDAEDRLNMEIALRLWPFIRNEIKRE